MEMGFGISVVTVVLPELVSGPPPVPDIITATTFDDATDTGTFLTSQGGTLHWAKYRAADGQPVLQANQTWAGETREVGSAPLGDTREGMLNFAPADATADRLVYGIITDQGVVSNLVAVTHTLSAAGPFSLSATPYGLIATYAGALTLTATPFGIIFSDGGEILGSIRLSAASYQVEENGVPGQLTVPALTAGTIAQASPEIGATLTVTGSNASGRAEYQWQLDGEDIDGATEATLDTTGGPAGSYRRGVREGLQGPVFTAAVAVSAVAPPPPAGGDIATHMGEQARETDVTVFPVTDIDVSAAAAGDMLVFIIGGAFHAADPSGATVNGKDATRLRQWNAGSGARGALFTYVLDAADISAGIISVQSDELGTGGQNSVFDFLITTGGAVVDHQQANSSTSLSVTTSNAQNTVFAFVHGVFNRFNGVGPVFSGVMPARLYKLATNNQGSAASILQNAPVGANNIQFTIDGTGNYSVIGVVIE